MISHAQMCISTVWKSNLQPDFAYGITMSKLLKHVSIPRLASFPGSPSPLQVYRHTHSPLQFYTHTRIIRG